MTLGNDNGTDGQTDRQTDRRTDRVRRNMRPPPREEGRIIIRYCYSIVNAAATMEKTFSFSMVATYNNINTKLSYR